MLLTLLEMVSSAALFGGAVGAAVDAHAGFGGYVLAITVGAPMAVFNAWIVDKAGVALGRLTALSSEARQNCWGVGFTLMILLWMPVAALVGGQVASELLRLM